MIDLYTCFDDMQGLYDKFSNHSETLEDHHDRMRRESIALEKVTTLKKHIKEILDGLPILDKLQFKTH